MDVTSLSILGSGDRYHGDPNGEHCHLLSVSRRCKNPHQALETHAAGDDDFTCRRILESCHTSQYCQCIHSLRTLADDIGDVVADEQFVRDSSAKHLIVDV